MPDVAGSTPAEHTATSHWRWAQGDRRSKSNACLVVTAARAFGRGVDGVQFSGQALCFMIANGEVNYLIPYEVVEGRVGIILDAKYVAFRAWGLRLSLRDRSVSG